MTVMWFRVLNQTHRSTEDFHARTKKSDIYIVGYFDLKSDPQQAMGCKKNL